ncbi:MAG TPA: mechanosensitive ion channel family protein [Micromonosporaceae bacterium]
MGDLRVRRLDDAERGNRPRVEEFLDLLRDTKSVLGRLVTTAVLLAGAAVVASLLGRLLARLIRDSYTRYYARKGVRYVVAVVLLLALAAVWRPFAGRAGVVIGLAAAGVALAMQEVIAALAAWVSILTGRHYRVGDRIQLGVVRGDVLDITPLRTKLLEIGGGDLATGEDRRNGPSPRATTERRARQHTGRIVSVSNRMIFSEPVYNSSAIFDHLWEELTLPIPYGDDWRLAERILREEAERASSSAAAQEAIAAIGRRYPVARTEIDPRVFVEITDNWVELSARFVVPVRQARAVKDEITRRVLDRLERHGIGIASETKTVNIRPNHPNHP